MRRIHFSLLFAAVLIAACTLSFGAPTSKTPRSSSEFRESLVAKTSGLVQSVQAANGHLAWAEQRGSSTVHLDGVQQGRKYDAVEYLEFNPDGGHLAFFAQSDQNQSAWFLVLDGQPRSEAFPTLRPLIFQPTGSSWAFAACGNTNLCQIIADGHSQKIYAQVTSPVYSPDGKKLAYLAESDGKWIAIVNGQIIGPPMAECSSFGFSPGSTRFYVAGRAKKLGWTYFVDGVPGPGFAVLSPIAFSSDDKHYIYAGSGTQLGFKKDATSGAIVTDGQKGPLFNGKGLPGEWTLLMDAAVATPEVYFGSPLLGPFFGPMVLRPGSHVFSANLNGVSDPVFDSEGNPAYAARRAAHDVVVIDGAQTGPSFDDVASDVVFSAEGRHSAYVATRSFDFVPVIDNEPGKPFLLDPKAAENSAKITRAAEDLPPPDPESGNYAPKPSPPNLSAFSVGWAVLTPNATHFAYEIVHGRENFRLGRTQRAERTVVIDGQPGQEFNALSISPIRFSDDDRHYWYTVAGAKGSQSLVVVDGLESKVYDNVSSTEYDKSGGQIVFFGRQGSRLLRVTFPLN